MFVQDLFGTCPELVRSFPSVLGFGAECHGRGLCIPAFQRDQSYFRSCSQNGCLFEAEEPLERQSNCTNRLKHCYKLVFRSN